MTIWELRGLRENISDFWDTAVQMEQRLREYRAYWIDGWNTLIAKKRLLAYYKRQRDLIIWPRLGSFSARLLEKLEQPGGAVEFMAIMRQMLTPELQTALQRMPYQAFLASDYWSIVRAWVVYHRGSRCEDCGTSGIQLDIHHLSYAHRGAEIFYLDNLCLLCRACHLRQHGVGSGVE
jgi:5-methylcytosine-specific restriction endonuclease McrA